MAHTAEGGGGQQPTEAGRPTSLSARGTKDGDLKTSAYPGGRAKQHEAEECAVLRATFNPPIPLLEPEPSGPKNAATFGDRGLERND